MLGRDYTFKREYQVQSVCRWNYFKVADIGLKKTGIYLSSADQEIELLRQDIEQKKRKKKTDALLLTGIVRV